MYPAKVPQITQLIERRIRQNFYSDRIPPTRVLAAELKVARQTMTDALKNLVQSGLLINCRRNGLVIDCSKLKTGTVAAVSRFDKTCIIDKFDNLKNIVNADGWKFICIQANNPRELEKQLPEDTLGVLFTSSSLTVESAEYLQKCQLPFVSCNQLPGYRQINWIDFDIARSLKILLKPIAQKGYKHVGVILSGHMENFNDLLRKELLKAKRELGLHHDLYDDIIVYWQNDFDKMLNQTLSFFQQKNSYPEVLLCFAQLTTEQCRQINQLPQPPQLLLTETGSNLENLPPGVIGFKSAISSAEVVRQGYELLRCAIFAPDMYPVQIQLEQKYVFFNDYFNQKGEKV